MTELTFLVELLLNHKLPKVTRDAVAARIRDVEAGIGHRPAAPMVQHAMARPLPGAQAASTQAILDRNPDLAAKVPHIPVAIVPEPVPVAVIAQTPAAVAAMASRNEAIAAAMSGKVDKTAGRPRKF